MTLTIGWWALPTIITLGVWLWVFTRTDPSPRGDYDFGSPIFALVQFGLAGMVTLTVWLVYFIIV